MNETEKENILEVARTYKNMCVSISTFTSFLDISWSDYINPVTERKILMAGHYADILGCKCWVSKEVQSGYIKVSNADITNSKEGKWSPPLLIEDAKEKELKRMMKLIAFW